jgi:hypothetical protein
MDQKRMMVFFVEEDIGSGRMGTDQAFLVAYDGEKSYSNYKSEEIPTTYEKMITFLKHETLIVYENENAMSLINKIMDFSKKVENIFNFKLGDRVILGMGNTGYSLGQLIVFSNEEVTNETI